MDGQFNWKTNYTIVMINFYVSKKNFHLIFDLTNRTFGVQLRVICGGIVGGSVRSLVETVNIIKYIAFKY